MREVRILRGIGFVVLATALYVCMNTGVKYLSPYLPTVELLWARSIGHLLFIVALFAPTHGGWRLFVTRKTGLQLLRSLMLLASSSFFFTAIAHVPLADATAISFTSPFMVAALAGPLLGERVRLSQWVVIAVGFCGALIVIRPVGGGANLYALLVFGSAICYAVYQTLTRQVGAFDAPETSVTYSGLVGTVVLSAIVPFYWVMPERLFHWVILAALGLLGGLGHYFVARGFQWGPASVLSPFHYVQLVAAAALGYLVFGDVPSRWTWVGATIIIGSGLYIAWRETARR